MTARFKILAMKFLLVSVVLGSLVPVVLSAQQLDMIVFGDASSETAHSFTNFSTITYTNTSVTPAQIARRC